MSKKEQPVSDPQAVPAQPTPAPGTDERYRATPEGDALNPTRYGDWEKNGQCIDF